MIDEKVLIERLENRNEYNKACHEEFPNAKMSLVYEVQINAYKNAIEIVKNLASEHNNGWIPCRERLPSKEEYLKDDGRFIVTDGNRTYQSHYDIYNGMFVWSSFASVPEEDKCVTAWQPFPELPAPYKKGE